MGEMRTLDCRGMPCPQPVLRTREALLEQSSPVTIIVDSESACANVRRFAESQGAHVTATGIGMDFHVAITPSTGATVGDGASAACSCSEGAARDLVVYVTSEGMGQGDDSLGRTLMAAFLDTLAHFKDEVSYVVFVNGGARLAVEDSPVLDQIRQLEQLGAQVLVCGTCLNHFGIREKLAVGSVSNMFSIIETLSKAGRIVRP